MQDGVDKLPRQRADSAARCAGATASERGDAAREGNSMDRGTAVCLGLLGLLIVFAIYMSRPHGQSGVDVGVGEAPTVTSDCSGPEELVKPATANLRAGPGTEHPITGRVAKKTLVRICAFRDDWQRVVVPGTELAGWMRQELTAAAPAPVIRDDPSRAETKDPERPRAAPRDALCSQIDGSVMDLIVQRREPETRSVFIDPELWSMLTFDKKRATIFYFSRCVKLPKLRDAYSGEVLGDENWSGFHVR